ncbi:hypothetical protein [Nocardia sp. CNY236]|uniref:hypothetical protein n=1 Tax=Nocardia sp. CNY236 TaxID=1169152 RepID=UPI00048FFD75|nr:hypothetical protein [Nocardia sp. CNY236]
MGTTGEVVGHPYVMEHHDIGDWFPAVEFYREQEQGVFDMLTSIFVEPGARAGDVQSTDHCIVVYFQEGVPIGENRAL